MPYTLGSFAGGPLHIHTNTGEELRHNNCISAMKLLDPPFVASWEAMLTMDFAAFLTSLIYWRHSKMVYGLFHWSLAQAQNFEGD
jgi:hypothetical protein